MRRMMRWFLLLFGGAWLMLGVGGCGSFISIYGQECLEDLSVMNSNGERRGCMVFSHGKSAWAVAYRSEGGKPGKFYFCSTSSRDCKIEMNNIPTANTSTGDETVVMAFPPFTYYQTFQRIDDFLADCSKLFSPVSPIQPSCWNDGPPTAAGEQKDCWYIFFVRYNRNQKQGSCARWRQKGE